MNSMSDLPAFQADPWILGAETFFQKCNWLNQAHMWEYMTVSDHQSPVCHLASFSAWFPKMGWVRAWQPTAGEALPQTPVAQCFSSLDGTTPLVHCSCFGSSGQSPLILHAFFATFGLLSEWFPNLDLIFKGKMLEVLSIGYKMEGGER